MVKELPNSQPFEQALLGSLMLYPSVMSDCLDADLGFEEFYLPSHQRIFFIYAGNTSERSAH